MLSTRSKKRHTMKKRAMGALSEEDAKYMLEQSTTAPLLRNNAIRRVIATHPVGILEKRQELIENIRNDIVTKVFDNFVTFFKKEMKIPTGDGNKTIDIPPLTEEEARHYALEIAKAMYDTAKDAMEMVLPESVSTKSERILKNRSDRETGARISDYLDSR